MLSTRVTIKIIINEKTKKDSEIDKKKINI